MLFTTPTQWAALAVALIAGWLFGLASHPGGRKWKQRYADEREVHAAARKDYDAKLGDANARIKELERENAQLAKAAPVMAATHSPTAQSAAVSSSYTRAPGSGRGWFDWRNRVGTNG